MTPAQQQAAKIKELSDALTGTNDHEWETNAPFWNRKSEELFAMIDSLASEVDRLSGLAATRNSVLEEAAVCAWNWLMDFNRKKGLNPANSTEFQLCSEIRALKHSAAIGAEECPRPELVSAIHTLASHYENALGAFGDDDEGRLKAEGDIAHAMKVAARHNYNGAEVVK